MSCNGCRVLRKGCSEGCVLRHCLRCIESPEAQAHATLFVTKFFGRAGLTGFINGVTENQRPALFQSLLYEACGRTVNPVHGAVGLLFSGNWAVCQAAVETVLRGGSPKPAALNIPTNHMKPNSTSALLDHPAGSLSTLDHPAVCNITNSAVFTNHKLIQPLPVPESSLATSASSFKANSFNIAAANHCAALDFSNYSASSSAEEMIMGSHFNKRSRDRKLEATVDEDPMIKRPRSCFLNGTSGAVAVAAVADARDAAHLTAARRPSISTWIVGYNKANWGRVGSNNCMNNKDFYAAAGRENHLVTGEEIKQEVHDGQANAANGLTVVQGEVQKQPHAPVARRVYIPPHIKKQELEKDIEVQKYGGVQMSKKRTAEGDDHNQALHARSGREEDCVPSLSCSVHQDTILHYECGDAAINTKLDLSLQAQHGKLCCTDAGELVNYTNSPHDTLDLLKHEEPHVLLRMSSPSVNSEGSVNTLAVGGLDTSSCTALASPTVGLKLLNLLH